MNYDNINLRRTTLLNHIDIIQTARKFYRWTSCYWNYHHSTEKKHFLFWEREIFDFGLLKSRFLCTLSIFMLYPLPHEISPVRREILWWRRACFLLVTLIQIRTIFSNFPSSVHIAKSVLQYVVSFTFIIFCGCC